MHLQVLTDNIKHSNTWLMKCHHILEWYEGTCNAKQVYSEIREIVRRALMVYTKGCEKAKFVTHIRAYSQEHMIMNLRKDFKFPAFR